MFGRIYQYLRVGWLLGAYVRTSPAQLANLPGCCSGAQLKLSEHGSAISNMVSV